MAYERLFEKLTKENLWVYILTMLKEHSDYALSLRRRIRDRFGFLPAKITFYIVLYRLEKEGLVESTKVQGRRIYSITEAGKEALGRAITLLERTLDSFKS